MILEEVESERRYSFYFENLDEDTSIESEEGGDGQESSNVHFQECFQFSNGYCGIYFHPLLAAFFSLAPRYQVW